MPNDKLSERRRMVVEEVEIPSKVEDSSKPEVVDEETKISSEELINNEKVQLKDSSSPKEEQINTYKLFSSQWRIRT